MCVSVFVREFIHPSIHPSIPSAFSLVAANLLQLGLRSWQRICIMSLKLHVRRIGICSFAHVASVGSQQHSPASHLQSAFSLLFVFLRAWLALSSKAHSCRFVML